MILLLSHILLCITICSSAKEMQWHAEHVNCMSVSLEKYAYFVNHEQNECQ